MSVRVSRFIGSAVIGAFVAAAPAAAQDLNGAGATFPQQIYSKWFAEYAAAKGVKINYQPIGSGGGVKAFQEGTVDFGASDAPMTDEEMGKLKAPAYHIPTVLGAVVLSYNLPEVTKPLNLTGEVVAQIFLGKITKWNAPEIAAINKGVALPAKDILVVHRTDGSGTTYIFTDYLTSVSPAWASGPGKAKDIQWPVGLGGKGNDGVAGQVKQLPGAIGYVELAYARQNKLAFASLKNSSGAFIVPSIESVTAAAAATAAKLPANTDFRVSIVNAAAKDAYPIASFTYLLVAETQTDAVKGKKLVDFMKWAIHEGQADAPALDYAPLPKNVVAMLDKRLSAVKNIAAK
ncbi:MAG TPA: phosphate ABC transporter substrate-binding protein PstS [Gemmatimonadaceae bacterium]|nr:phosphate ABC transporter substrate-binding protein PstS [Gemmatimonadaceae bacterium]